MPSVVSLFRSREALRLEQLATGGQRGGLGDLPTDWSTWSIDHGHRNSRRVLVSGRQWRDRSNHVLALEVLQVARGQA
jgi:hypothetical protein